MLHSSFTRDRLFRKLAWLPVVLVAICGVQVKAQFLPAVNVSTAFNDAAGFQPPEYGTTIMIGFVKGNNNVNGSYVDICGRLADGIYCDFGSPAGFSNTLTKVSNDFTDAQGWNQSVTYYHTIQLADVNGDGAPDLCGRSPQGVVCALNLNDGSGHFAPATLVETWFADWYGAEPSYGSTVMMADLNGDGQADICFRIKEGVACEISMGLPNPEWGNPALAGNGFWDDPGSNFRIYYYGTLRFADFEGSGHLSICGRTAWGVACMHGNGDGTFQTATTVDNYFLDTSNGNPSFYLPQYSTTIMFPDIDGDGKADLCMRGPNGILCKYSTGTRFTTQPNLPPGPNGDTSPPFLAVGFFSDANGFDKPTYYGSIRFAKMFRTDGKPAICGRGPLGIYCAMHT